MLMTVLLPIALGLCGVLILAHIARFVAVNLLSEEKADVASFSFTLGGIATSQGLSAVTPTPLIGFHIGTVVGIAIVWFLLFQRRAATG